MARYTSKSEFMHDFAAGMTAQVSDKNATSTYLRARKRQQAKADAYARGFIRSDKERAEDQKILDARHKDDAAKGKMFADVARRVQKEHPELSWFKARTYARTKDPVGRMIRRMEHTHSAEEIKEAISKIKGTKKASSGRSSG
ncbi:hypothetical protein [Limosilactobacillus oris]|uniref:hypothetical protein n=1 Tax=Limosilactobacillus oris TaxID=1632 RepID=UPI0022355121|nr:hypothetical protein [Limosilactobacillus oris]MCW4387007.1 hypothetical protein [Limosilactobacillus oris]